MKFFNEMLVLSILTNAHLLVKVLSIDPYMYLVRLPESTSPGGKCMDGSMAGYYIREGSNKSLFVIFLKGGGGCSKREDCDKRVNTTLGSSIKWDDKIIEGRFLDANCDRNPDFCEATAVHIPYCTSDTHRGTKAEKSPWGYYFDGHLNFKAIVEKLVTEKGLGNASHVLLSGSSAGAIGAIFNVDWLNDRLSNTTVKVVPNAGWYSPGALSDDLPSPHYPSNFPHFELGDKGNEIYDMIQSGVSGHDIMGVKDMLSTDCLSNFSDEDWWACTSVHFAYKYIKSPIYAIHTQYDKNQLEKQNQLPDSPANDTQLDAMKKYVQMWGIATRSSLQQLVGDNVFQKEHKDGVFSASCITHGTSGDVSINGKTFPDIVNDWFFQKKQLESYYKLIESCSPLPGNENYVIPCNVKPQCHYEPSSNQNEQGKECAKLLNSVGCVKSFGKKQDCLKCAQANNKSLFEANCKSSVVQLICTYAEKNDIFDEFQGDELDVDKKNETDDPNSIPGTKPNNGKASHSYSVTSRSILCTLSITISLSIFLNHL